MWFATIFIVALFVRASGFTRVGGGLARTSRCAGVGRLAMGYIPPEKDPEYRPMVKKSLLKPMDGDESAAAMKTRLPVPKEGDIVGAPGKWEGEIVLGKIRFLQYSNSTKVWNADIVPLVEGKSTSVWVVIAAPLLRTWRRLDPYRVSSCATRTDTG